MGRTTLRTGGFAALGGGGLAVVGNLLHPRYSDIEDFKLYGKIAGSVRLSVADMVIMLALLLTAVGFVSLARALEGDGGPDSLARYGGATALVGVAIALIQVSVEVFAFKQAARAFIGADPSDKVSAFWATNAVDHLNAALFSTWILVYLGITPLLLGIVALRRRAAGPVFGLIGIVGGACCIVVAVINLLHEDQSTTIIPFLIGSLLVTAWIIWAGIWMSRASSATTQTA